MQVSVLKRDNGTRYMYKMLFLNRVFPGNFDDYNSIMSFIKETYGYKLGDEFLVLFAETPAWRVKIKAGGIFPEWGCV